MNYHLLSNFRNHFGFSWWIIVLIVAVADLSRVFVSCWSFVTSHWFRHGKYFFPVIFVHHSQPFKINNLKRVNDPWRNLTWLTFQINSFQITHIFIILRLCSICQKWYQHHVPHICQQHAFTCISNLVINSYLILQLDPVSVPHRIQLSQYRHSLKRQLPQCTQTSLL